ncbi:MAG TPA: N-acylneuraminate-9-phosphate synthase [Alphaproteobacteria bacterium]|nr:N-acylneuraminate-9-phosphate synthase [Alphaproteobacteria bacterium]
MRISEFPESFSIAGRTVGDGTPCYVIAEAGISHFGDLEKAKRLVDLAANAGCDAVKFQHYSTDILVGPSARDWRERLRSKEISDEEILQIKQHCDKIGMVFLCTGHEERALEFLVREAAVPAIKIGSGEIENWPYLEIAAGYEIPVILSTGMYTLQQVTEAVGILKSNGCPSLAVLHCVTNYPAEPATVNLSSMSQIRQIFSGPVGYSDHTMGHAIPMAAVALGAELLEKHLTIDVNVPNAQDWKVSVTPDSLPRFMRELRSVEAARGGWEKAPSTAEKESISWARKSITARQDIKSGHIITNADVVCQRPGTGMPPTRLTEVLGAKAVNDILAGTILSPEMFIS